MIAGSRCAASRRTHGADQNCHILSQPIGGLSLKSCFDTCVPPGSIIGRAFARSRSQWWLDKGATSRVSMSQLTRPEPNLFIFAYQCYQLQDRITLIFIIPHSHRQFCPGARRTARPQNTYPLSLPNHPHIHTFINTYIHKNEYKYGNLHTDTLHIIRTQVSTDIPKHPLTRSPGARGR